MKAEHSRRTKLIVVAAPLAITGILVGLEMIAIVGNGFETANLAVWAWYLVCFAFFFLPLIMTGPRSVMVNDHGIHLSRFVGKSRVIRWPDIKRIDIRGPAGSKGLYVKPVIGRATTIPGIMVNYENVAAAIVARAPTGEESESQ